MFNIGDRVIFREYMGLSGSGIIMKLEFESAFILLDNQNKYDGWEAEDYGYPWKGMSWSVDESYISKMVSDMGNVYE